MSSRKFFTKSSFCLISFGALGFYSPIYAHHVPGPTSASVVISIPGTATSVTLTTNAADPNFRLTCTEANHNYEERDL